MVQKDHCEWLKEPETYDRYLSRVYEHAGKDYQRAVHDYPKTRHFLYPEVDHSANVAS